MQEVLVNRLGDLSLPRKTVVRLTDRPDMTIAVYRGRKNNTTITTTTAQKADLLEHLQHEAARIVTGLTRSVSSDNLYKECGWPSLAIRRKLKKNKTLHFMYKAINNKVPECISDIIPFRKRPN